MIQSAAGKPALPLAFTLEHAEGRYRIVMVGSDREPIEAPTLDAVLDSLKHALHSSVTPSTDEAGESGDNENESRLLDEIARGFPSKAAFDQMIERHPIPPAWHDESDWTPEAE